MRAKGNAFSNTPAIRFNPLLMEDDMAGTHIPLLNNQNSHVHSDSSETEAPSQHHDSTGIIPSTGRLGDLIPERHQGPLTPEQREIQALRAQLVRVTLERDIYRDSSRLNVSASSQLHGTRFDQAQKHRPESSEGFDWCI
jgi:hypothetical protein